VAEIATWPEEVIGTILVCWAIEELHREAKNGPVTLYSKSYTQPARVEKF
jgi:hypothetical protein